MRKRLYRLAQRASRRLLSMEFEFRPPPAWSSLPKGVLHEREVPAAGLTMALDLSESLDRCYFENMVDEVPIKFVRENLAKCTWFADIGANQGLYTCIALHEFPEVFVVAVEPDPYSAKKLMRNIALNHLDEERLVFRGLAVGPDEGEATLMLNTAGNRAGSSVFLDQRPWTGLHENVTLNVQQGTLRGVLAGVFSLVDPWMIKLDIEGFEYPVLDSFFRDAPQEEWPSFVIVEAFGRLIQEAGGSPIQLLIERGYGLVDHDDVNFCLAR